MLCVHFLACYFMATVCDIIFKVGGFEKSNNIKVVINATCTNSCQNLKYSGLPVSSWIHYARTVVCFRGSVCNAQCTRNWKGPGQYFGASCATIPTLITNEHSLRARMKKAALTSALHTHSSLFHIHIPLSCVHCRRTSLSHFRDEVYI
jgi:hypothetical protein